MTNELKVIVWKTFGFRTDKSETLTNILVLFKAETEEKDLDAMLQDEVDSIPD